MNINYIDQLTQWWDEAEIPNANTLPRDGDRIIVRYNSEWYEIATADGYADESEIGSNTRILARAPKPKPAWHDAVAVIATRNRDHGYVRGVLANVGGGRWHGVNGGIVNADDLTDVTPLIEAKVTDEAMQRVFNALDPSVNWRLSMTKDDEKYVRYIVAAALGLDPA